MSFGGIKIYHLILLDFSRNEYKIFKYEKDRRYTAKQAWNVIYSEADTFIKSEKLSSNANIDDYGKIVDELKLNLKYCDRYMIFVS